VPDRNIRFTPPQVAHFIGSYDFNLKAWRCRLKFLKYFREEEGCHSIRAGNSHMPSHRFGLACGRDGNAICGLAHASEMLKQLRPGLGQQQRA
jgi:hypothetical protein